MSTLNALLGQSPAVATLGIETYFVSVHGGLRDLTDAVSSNFSSIRADGALHRFDRLMRHDLVSPRSYPFNRINLRRDFGAAWDDAIDGYFRDLGARKYRGDGLTIDTGMRANGFHAPYKLKSIHLPNRIGRERDYLWAMPRLARPAAVHAARSLLLSLYANRARTRNAQAWVDQTSGNLMDAPFWAEVLPEARFVHVVRDPMQVALSQRATEWAPTNWRLLCTTIRDSFEHTAAVLSVLPQEMVTVVRFEALAASPGDQLARLGQWLGLELDDSVPLSPERFARLPGPGANERAEYEAILGPTAVSLGYSSTGDSPYAA